MNNCCCIQIDRLITCLVFACLSMASSVVAGTFAGLDGGYYFQEVYLTCRRYYYGYSYKASCGKNLVKSMTTNINFCTNN